MPKYKKTSSPAVNVTENANLAPAVNVPHMISQEQEHSVTFTAGADVFF